MSFDYYKWLDQNIIELKWLTSAFQVSNIIQVLAGQYLDMSDQEYVQGKDAILTRLIYRIANAIYAEFTLGSASADDLSAVGLTADMLGISNITPDTLEQVRNELTSIVNREVTAAVDNPYTNIETEQVYLLGTLALPLSYTEGTQTVTTNDIQPLLDMIKNNIQTKNIKIDVKQDNKRPDKIIATININAGEFGASALNL